MKITVFTVLRYIIHLTAGLPLIWLGYNLYTDNLSYFGSDPIKEIIHFLGWGAILAIIVLFGFRLIVQLSNNKMLLSLHRPLGLWGLCWGTLHIISYLAFELAFDFSLFLSELLQRFYLQLGLIALLSWVVIAVSSIPYLRRKLSARWFKLHQFSHLVLALAVWHYFLAVKGYDLYSLLFIVLATVFIIWKYFNKSLMRLVK